MRWPNCNKQALIFPGYMVGRERGCDFHQIMIKMRKISLEIPTRGVLCKTVFLTNWQNSQKNTYSKVSFLIKLQAEGCNFSIKETLKQVFSIPLHLFFINNPFLTLVPKIIYAFLKNHPKNFFGNINVYCLNIQTF